MSEGVVSAIHLHPIKSCHRVEVAAAVVGTTGLVGDREWQLSTTDGPATQRRHPVLATVRPTPIEGGLRISAPGHPTIEVARPAAVDTTTLALNGATVEVGDAGEEAAAWFCDLIGDPVRLVALPPAAGATIPAPLDLFGQPNAFGDISPVLVTNTASLRWLVERASEPFGMDRFRPNLVVDTDTPFAEDTWDRFRLGAASLVHGLVWPRCTIPQVDQDSGTRNREPARVLRTHRWCTGGPAVPDGYRPIVDNSVVFGIGCAIGEPGTVVSVGDPLAVETSRDPLVPNPALG